MGRGRQWLPALALPLPLPTAHQQALHLLAFSCSMADKEEELYLECGIEGPCCDFPWGPGDSLRVWEPTD